MLTYSRQINFYKILLFWLNLFWLFSLSSFLFFQRTRVKRAPLVLLFCFYSKYFHHLGKFFSSISKNEMYLFLLWKSFPSFYASSINLSLTLSINTSLGYSFILNNIVLRYLIFLTPENHPAKQCFLHLYFYCYLFHTFLFFDHGNLFTASFWLLLLTFILKIIFLFAA